MQISRHWRLNATRYRLQGCEYEDGTKSLQQRPTLLQGMDAEAEMTATEVAEEQSEKTPIAAA